MHSNFEKGAVYFTILLAVVYAEMMENPTKYGRPAVSVTGVLEMVPGMGHPGQETLRTLCTMTMFPGALLEYLLQLSPTEYYEKGTTKLIETEKRHIRRLYQNFLTDAEKRRTEASINYLKKLP